jgi:hypothetical protein
MVLSRQQRLGVVVVARVWVVLLEGVAEGVLLVWVLKVRESPREAYMEQQQEEAVL